MLNKKLAYFHTEFAYSGGAERIVFEEIKGLKKAGYTVDLYASFVDEINCYPSIIKNFNIKQILPKILNFLPHDILIVLTTLLFPITLLRYKKYDIYFGANQAGPWWAYMASKFYKKPYYTYQNYPTTITHPRKIDRGVKRNSFLVNMILSVFKKIIISFDKLVIRSASARFSNGEYVTRICKEAYRKEFINCPGGTFKGEFNRKIFEKRLEKPYILITNRNFPAKRFDYGIFALKNVNLPLVIAGAETKYSQEIKRLAKKLGVLDKLYFTGLLEGKKLRNAYKYAYIYLYTAPEEDFGLGIIEAMSYGVPVVAWKSAGPRYIIKNKLTGYLAKTGKQEDFTNKIIKLVSDKKLNYQIAKNAYLESKKYTWDNHCNILLSGIDN